MNRVVSDLKSLKLKDDEWDAISFFKSTEGYKFLIVKFDKKQDYEISEELGTKYIMFHIDSRDGNVPTVEEAYIGDPLHVITNYTKANCEGVFAKKSSLSKRILEQFIFGKDTTARFEDFRDYVKEAKSSDDPPRGFN